MNLITQRSERYAAPHNAVSDGTLFNVALLTGMERLRGMVRVNSALVLRYGEDGQDTW